MTPRPLLSESRIVLVTERHERQSKVGKPTDSQLLDLQYQIKCVCVEVGGTVKWIEDESTQALKVHRMYVFFFKKKMINLNCLYKRNHRETLVCFSAYLHAVKILNYTVPITFSLTT